MKNFSKFSKKKVIVTGTSGFIGTHLCRRLYESGAEVYGISRSVHPNKNNNLIWWQGDLVDIEVAREFLITIKPDFIFHLASHVVGSRNLEIVLPTFYNNLATTVNLLTVATEISCHRIILAGSLEEPEQNDIHTTPSSPYAAAKWSCTTYARMFHALYQTPVTIARIFMVYGSGQKDFKKLIPYVTISLLSDEAPKLSSGQRQVDWIYIEDVVDGLLAMAHAPNIEGYTIDIGSGVLVPIRTIVKYLVNIIEPNAKPEFGAIPDRPMEQVRVANVDNTYAKIGWKPMISLEEGLKYTVDWYREQL